MSVPDPDPLIGARLGRYEVLGRLGEGGMGVVYRARDTELEREVALKVLPPDALADAELRATLLHEARTASQLNHPNVCTIHEVGQDGGRIYVAMELVQGRPLRELIPPGGLPDETVVRYAAPLARALAHAHERRVVHRDLKTANVVIGPGGQPKLLDFGLSRRILDETSRGAPAMATSGGVAGTPQYLAPEILMGGRAGASSDLWALGVVLYELCSGTVPFSGGPLGSVVTAILHATPAPLPDHTGPGLRAVTMRCLAKEPSQRYSSAAEAAAALEALLPGSLATGGSPRSRYRLRWPPRRRVVFALGASAMAVVAVAAWWFFADRGRAAGPGAERTVLVYPMEVRGQVDGSGFAGRAFAEALAIRLAQSKGLRVMPVPAATEIWNAGLLGKARAAELAGAGRFVDGALTREGDSLRVRVSLVDSRATRILWGEERTASGGDLSLLAAGLATPLARELGARPARLYDYFTYVTGTRRMAASPELAEAVGAVRRYELPQSLEATKRLVDRFPREPDALVLRVAALSIDLRASGPDSARGAALDDALAALRRSDPDNPWHDAARAMLAPPGPEPARLLARVADRDDLAPAARGALLAMRADVLGAVGDTAAAIADCEQAVELDPASDLSLSTLARALTRAGRHAEAAQRMRQALALNPTVVNYWMQLGNCMLRQGLWREYVADFQRASALSADPGAVLSSQSDGLSAVGRHREAADCARLALRQRPERWKYGLQLARSQMRMGEWGDALPLLERACSQGGPEHCRILAGARAVALQLAGNPDAAQAEANRAGDAAGTAPGAESRSSAYALACYHALRGERDAAMALLQRFAARGWIEPALGSDPNFASLRSDPRFQRTVSWMRAQPLDRTLADWGRSL